MERRPTTLYSYSASLYHSTCANKQQSCPRPITTLSWHIYDDLSTLCALNLLLQHKDHMIVWHDTLRLITTSQIKVDNNPECSYSFTYPSVQWKRQRHTLYISAIIPDFFYAWAARRQCCPTRGGVQKNASNSADTAVYKCRYRVKRSVPVPSAIGEGRVKRTVEYIAKTLLTRTSRDFETERGII